MEKRGNAGSFIGFYFQALTGILGSPGQFFSEFSRETGFWKPFGCLIMSSLFFTLAGLTQVHENQALMAGILFLNAVSMPFITAGTAYMVMTMTIGKGVTFVRLFSGVAFAAAITLLASWIPLFVWLTEPWKWALILIWMVKGCGLRWMQAILIAGISAFVLVLFFWSLGSVISCVRGFIL